MDKLKQTGVVRPYKPYRLGKKQERVILDEYGLEVCVFHEHTKHLAPLVVDFLNRNVLEKR